MRIRRNKPRKSRRAVVRRDCWLGFIGIKLLGLSWLWYWNLSAILTKDSTNDETSTALQRLETDNGCQSFGCPRTPSDYDNRHEEANVQFNDETTIATMTRKSNRQRPPVNQDAAVVYAPFVTRQTTHKHDFFVGVFDGHGTQGHDVAQYAAKAVPERLAEKFNEDSSLRDNDSIVEALKETFVEVDAEAPPSALLGGCTATVTLRREKTLFIANTGDSRTIVVSVSDQSQDVIYTTRKDKPHLPDELERITRLGGKVHIPPQNPMLSRVVIYSEAAHDQIGLAMSRSIGDWEWGVQGVTAEPIVHILPINDDNMTSAFIVAASDGLWDVRQPQFVAKHFADSFYRHSKTPLETCEFMIDKASPAREDSYRDDITLVAMKIVY